MQVRIYITNLAKYNEGKLIGKWLDLPLDEEDLQSEIKNVLGNDEEAFITDFESPVEISEYESPFELNEFAERLDELDEHDQQKLFYLLDMIGLTREEALEKYEEVSFYPDMTLENLAEEFVEEGIYGEIPDSIKNYIDYEAIARDLNMEGYHQTEKGTFWYQ